MGVGQDYKKRGNSRPTPPKKKKPPTQKTRFTLPAWLWFLAGLAVMAAFFTLMNDETFRWPSSFSTPQTGMAETAPKKPTPAQKTDPKPTDPRPMPEVPDYGFYEALPHQGITLENVEVQEVREATQKPNQDQRSVNPQKNTIKHPRYVLQVGSFKSKLDAKTRKAELALLGLVSQIRTASVQGTTWHRVYVGPAIGKRKLNDLKSQLSSLGIDYLTIPVD